MTEHSRRPDLLLSQPRTAILFELNHNGTRPKDALKQLTIGHQYYRQHLDKPKGTQYLKLKPGNFLLMCERSDVLLGKVVQLHVLRSDSCPFPDASLKELTKQRLQFRDDPSTIPDLATYFQYRKSCWLIEETEDGQFRCDCPIGHKGKVCKHELGLNYKHDRIEVLPHAAALKLGTRRGKGRPKNITMEKPKEAYSAISSTNRTEEEENTPAGEDEANSDINIEVRVEARGDMVAELDGLIGLLATAAPDLQEAPAAVEVLPAAQAVELPDTPEAGELQADVEVLVQAADKEVEVQPAAEEVQAADKEVDVHTAAEEVQPADTEVEVQAADTEVEAQAVDTEMEVQAADKGVVVPAADTEVEIPAAAEELEGQAAAGQVEVQAAPKSANIPVEIISKKKGQCSCSGCTATDCTICKMCKDMKKYGGQGKLKKKCLLKRCLKVATSPAPPKGTKKKTPIKGAAKKKQATPSSSTTSKRKRVRSPPNSPIPQPPQRRQRVAAPTTSSNQSTTTISLQPVRPVRATKRAGALFQ